MIIVVAVIQKKKKKWPDCCLVGLLFNPEEEGKDFL
jgi:hypothetical protein